MKRCYSRKVSLKGGRTLYQHRRCLGWGRGSYGIPLLLSPPGRQGPRTLLPSPYCVQPVKPFLAFSFVARPSLADQSIHSHHSRNPNPVVFGDLGTLPPPPRHSSRLGLAPFPPLPILFVETSKGRLGKLSRRDKGGTSRSEDWGEDSVGVGVS
jgi:hypothetical protein